MRVEDIMSTNVITATPGMSIVEAAKILRKNKIHSLPVVDETNKLAGIITEMDFFVKDTASFYLPQWMDILNKIKEVQAFSLEDDQEKMDYIIDLRVEEIMTKKVISVGPEFPVTELMEIFKKLVLKAFQ